MHLRAGLVGRFVYAPPAGAASGATFLWRDTISERGHTVLPSTLRAYYSHAYPTLPRCQRGRARLHALYPALDKAALFIRAQKILQLGRGGDDVA
jgi:hypothetical protein